MVTVIAFLDKRQRFLDKQEKKSGCLKYPVSYLINLAYGFT